jgi:hypothetical protein
MLVKISSWIIYYRDNIKVPAAGEALWCGQRTTTPDVESVRGLLLRLEAAGDLREKAAALEALAVGTRD